MKISHVVGTLSVLFSFISILAQAAPSAQVLGVRNGVYRGSGTLQSQVYPVPDLGFISQRSVSNGTITATTRAYLLTNTESVANQMIRQAVLATSNGFVISGSQNFYGLRSVYRARMNRPAQ